METECTKAMETNGEKGSSETDASTFIPSLRPLARTQIPLGPHPEDEYYNMSHPNKGLAIILNHQYFDSLFYKERRGTEFDRDVMKNVLKTMGFHVEVYDDYTRDEILTALKVVSKMDHSTNSCLVIAVMSHGRSYGRLSAKDKEYTTNELIEFFTGENCPTLIGKPKLFFIQACRGEKTDSGVKVQSDNVGSEKIVYTIPAMADILIMYATVEGYYAWRDTTKGGCFIQSLARQLEAHHKKRDLLSILTIVNREVAVGFESRSPIEDFDKKKAMCSIVSMLTRTLLFE